MMDGDGEARSTGGDVDRAMQIRFLQ